MRTLASLVILACLGCASAGGGRLEMGMGGGSCEDSCRAASDHCSHDSRRREPDGATCAEDLRGCLARCADFRGGSQAVRYMTRDEILLTAAVNALLGLFR